MDDKYINFDIDDPRAGAIAEVMGNKTSKRIISLLAERELSESDIASELGLPLNTVGYNIAKLLKAGLIEKTKNFFWSTKGKKIPTYKLSNKKILISPKKMIPALPIAIIIGIIGVLIVLVYLGLSGNNVPGSAHVGNDNMTIQNNNLKQFNSYDEITNYLNKSYQDNLDMNGNGEGYGYGVTGGGRVMMAEAAAAAPGVMNAASSAKDLVASSGASVNSGSSGSVYSQTNVQVAGVDEPDIVKNDGKYIYTVSGQNVVITDAYPASSMNNVSLISLNNSILGIFVNGNKLIVFNNIYESSYYGGPETYGAMAKTNSGGIVGGNIAMPCLGCGGRGYTQISIYDISDKSNAVLLQNISLSGNYEDARMIGDYVYLITTDYINSQYPIMPVYAVNGNEKQVAPNNIYYPNYEESNYVFTSILAVNVNGNNDVNNIANKVYLTGQSSVIFVSQNNIYLSYTKTMNQRDIADGEIKALVEILPVDLKDNVSKIYNSNQNVYQKYYQIMQTIGEYSSSLSGDERDKFDTLLSSTIQNYTINIQKEFEKTEIDKISIDNLKINFVGSGFVKGHLLNQFSMDEFDGNLRVATTVGESYYGDTSNNVEVLDKNLNLIGSVENIAPGESIYAARFIGDRAYIVTFKTIDPFFVIDLSDTSNPKVLGFIKIPGYSQYLQPYDENHIIGIGKDVDESIDADKIHTPGAVYYTAVKGIKVSLYDVSDVSNPVEESTITLGESGSDSYALTDHKSILFDKDKNLLVLPMTLDTEKNVSYYYGSYIQSTPVWQGAYVFNIDKNGITVKGNITHFENLSSLKPAIDESVGSTRVDQSGNIWTKIAVNAWKTDAKNYDYSTYGDDQIDSFPGGVNDYTNSLYNDEFQVKRSLFINNTLYTISPSAIKANDLTNLDQISKISLPYQRYYPIMYATPMMV